jgi:hypothetical protein
MVNLSKTMDNLWVKTPIMSTRLNILIVLIAEQLFLTG